MLQKLLLTSLSVLLFTGCTFMNKKADGTDKSAYFGRQAPSDVSQVQKVTVYGLYIFPDGFALGYVNAYESSTPGYDKDTYVPDAYIEEIMTNSAGSKIRTRYGIGQLGNLNVIMDYPPIPLDDVPVE